MRVRMKAGLGMGVRMKAGVGHEREDESRCWSSKTELEIASQIWCHWLTNEILGALK